MIRHQGEKAEGIRLAYIGGGSRGWAWKFMTDLADEPSMSGEVVLYDIDREAAEANAVIGRLVDESISRWVLGDEPISDESFDQFEKDLQEAGLTEFMAFWQDILEGISK